MNNSERFVRSIYIKAHPKKKMSLVESVKENPAEFVGKLLLALLVIPLFYLAQLSYKLKIIQLKWRFGRPELTMLSLEGDRMLKVRNSSDWIELKLWHFLRALPIVQKKDEE